MDALIYLIIAAVLFIVAIVVEMILVKKDAVKDMVTSYDTSYDTSDIAIAITITFFLSVAWILTIPVGILALAVYGISRWVANWLNE